MFKINKKHTESLPNSHLANETDNTNPHQITKWLTTQNHIKITLKYMKLVPRDYSGTSQSMIHVQLP